MESFLNRYRNITVLLLVIFAQLVLLAAQVKNSQDVRMIRVWTVTAVTPVARLVEAFRGGGVGFARNYVLLHNADAENRRLQADLDRLKVENIFLRNELNTADRAKALQLFQAQTPSKTLAARIIGIGPGVNSKMVFVDRGSLNGVERGMAVVTPDGIVGKVIGSYPSASEVLLVTDPDFAAGVISQKTGVRGTLKGQGTPMCRVDYVPYEEKVDPGEWFYTSGDDRIFPRGFPVGVIKAVRNVQPYKEIIVEPSGLQRGLNAVLILLDTVHMEIPSEPPAAQPVYIAPPAPALPDATAAAQPNAAAPQPGAASPQPGAAAGQPQPTPSGGTEADKLRSQYRSAGDEQKHTFGEGLPGTKPPDFTRIGLPPAPVGQKGSATQKAPGAGNQAPSNPARGAAAPPTGVPAGVPKASESAKPQRPAQPAAATPTPGTPAGAGKQGPANPSRVGAPAVTPKAGENTKPQQPAQLPASNPAPGARPAVPGPRPAGETGGPPGR